MPHEQAALAEVPEGVGIRLLVGFDAGGVVTQRDEFPVVYRPARVAEYNRDARNVVVDVRRVWLVIVLDGLAGDAVDGVVPLALAVHAGHDFVAEYGLGGPLQCLHVVGGHLLEEGGLCSLGFVVLMVDLPIPLLL